MKTRSIAGTGGFTLTELLVAMALSTLLIAGAGQVLASNQRQTRLIDELADMHATARHALSVISSDLRQAGYFGEATDVAPDQIAGTVAATGTCVPAAWGRQIGFTLSATNDALRNPGVADAPCVARDAYLRGDVLTVRYARAASARQLAAADNAQRLYLVPAPPPGQSRIAAGNSAVDLAAAMQPWRAYELIARSYFIGNALDSATDARCTPLATPALMRTTLDSRGLPVREELLRNVEHLQIEFGIDNDGDGSVERYVNPDEVPITAGVAAARLGLLIRSPCPDASHENHEHYRLGDRRYSVRDHFRRVLVSTTVALRRHGEQAQP